MCMVSLYKHEKKPENLLMENVFRVVDKDGLLQLTDIMGRQLTMEGRIALADLNNNFILVEPRA